MRRRRGAYGRAQPAVGPAPASPWVPGQGVIGSEALGYPEFLEGLLERIVMDMLAAPEPQSGDD